MARLSIALAVLALCAASASAFTCYELISSAQSLPAGPGTVSSLDSYNSCWSYSFRISGGGQTYYVASLGGASSTTVAACLTEVNTAMSATNSVCAGTGYSCNSATACCITANCNTVQSVSAVAVAAPATLMMALAAFATMLMSMML